MELIFGTTIFIGEFKIDTFYGQFQVKVYQDLIHKGYILSLCHGDINKKELTTRIHSSCITSETLGSMDCDCVHQLNGALERISKTDGILFYLIQEGRGCGYVGKSRACMLVQESEQHEHNNITTFDAYKIRMKADYRQYTNIGDICNMLKINPEWILLSNNPDKINGLISAGQKIKEISSIEIPPNPFNYSYLMSKKKTGHLLYNLKTKTQPKFEIPKKISSFSPYVVKAIPRFIHCSSYYLPIKPPQGYFILENLNSNYQKIKTLKSNQYLYYSKENVQDKVIPFWFKVNVYYDKISHADFVVLKYCDSPDEIPLVRIHSESILNRFPLTKPKYRQKYQHCIIEIVKRGYGYIFLFHKDGRGNSLGNLCLNLESNSGINDNRDYQPITELLKHHTNNKKIDIFRSGVSFERMKNYFVKQDVNVRNWIKID